MVHTVKGFGIVNKAEIDVFLELSCFYDDPVDVGNLISGSSAFSKSSLNIWNFIVHILSCLESSFSLFYLYFFDSMNLGETVVCCGPERLGSCGSIPL